MEKQKERNFQKVFFQKTPVPEPVNLFSICMHETQYSSPTNLTLLDWNIFLRGTQAKINLKNSPQDKSDKKKKKFCGKKLTLDLMLAGTYCMQL
jgi:hypothetical protein